jgi:hypothetical protein
MPTGGQRGTPLADPLACPTEKLGSRVLRLLKHCDPFDPSYSIQLPAEPQRDEMTVPGEWLQMEIRMERIFYNRLK